MDGKWELALVTVIAGAALAAPAHADSFAEFGKSREGAPPAVEDDRDGTAPRHDEGADGAAPRSGHPTHGIGSDDDADAPAPKSKDDSDGAASTHAESPAARADESEDSTPTNVPEDPWTSHRLTLELQFGLGTPIGGIGMAGTYTVVDELSLGAGLGVGSGPNEVGPHAAVFALLRPFHGKRNALVIDTALSTGPYERFDISGVDLGVDSGSGRNRRDEQTVTADWAHFIQLALGWEYRSRRGTVLRITTGWARMLNPSARKCTATSFMTRTEYTCDVGSDQEDLGTLEFALGHAF